MLAFSFSFAFVARIDHYQRLSDSASCLTELRLSLGICRTVLFHVIGSTLPRKMYPNFQGRGLGCMIHRTPRICVGEPAQATPQM